MNKIPLTLLAVTLSLLNTSIQASEVQSPSFSPGEALLLSLINNGAASNFSAINHTIINETTYPNSFPSPGDTFVTNGYGVLVPSFAGMELTYSYSISGVFTDYDNEGKLFFNHVTTPDVSNQLVLYIDSAINPDTLNADEDNDESYTDGLKIATMDLVIDDGHGETGYLQQSTNTGKDIVTFKLSESDMQEYGFSSDTVLLNKISSVITLADVVDEGFQAFDFGAFGSNCGPLDNPYNSCAREIGTSELVLASAVPVPASLGLFLSGFGLLGWLKKRK
jgi:hypothetical protein